MRYGASFPHAIGADPVAVRDYVQALEGSGFDYLLTIDHVAGVHPGRFGEKGPPFNYTHETPTHELFTLFAYLAGLTERIEFVPSVLLLAQRPTVLVAKQAAEVAILSKGRLRLPVGVGWNYVEYGALGANFHDRGKRLEEQVEVMKLLWSQPLVTFKGKWHDLDGIAINPLPGYPIPIWFGGGAEEPLLRRAVKYGEGWMPLLTPDVDREEAVNRLQRILREEGRDPSTFGLDVRLNVEAGEQADWVAAAKRWQEMGATHVVLTVGPLSTQRTPSQLLETLTRARSVLQQEIG